MTEELRSNLEYVLNRLMELEMRVAVLEREREPARSIPTNETYEEAMIRHGLDT